MIFDNEFRNIDAVKRMAENYPVLVDFNHLSPDVRDLLFDVHDHLDAMAGYADWYIRVLTPPAIASQAFINADFWKRLEQVRMHAGSSGDRLALDRIAEVAQFVEKLSLLIFCP